MSIIDSTVVKSEDLPAWMRPRNRGLDRAWLLIIGFSLLLALPLLLHPGLPGNTDAELYEYRSLEVRRIFQTGVLFSRWAPDFNFALGSPIFNYLAPLPHYIAGLHQEITEVGPAASVKLWLGLSILVAAGGMYCFVRQRWGKRAGLVSALVYLFSPPIAFALPYQTGDLAPLMALAMLPWALWAMTTLYEQPTRQTLWIATLSLATFWLTDRRIALLGMLVILALVVSLIRWPRSDGRNYRYLLFSIVVVALLTAFFWLPALAERDEASWTALVADTRVQTIPLTESFGLPPISDMSLLNPPLSRSIGLATALLGALGAGALIINRRDKALIQSIGPFLLLGLLLLVLSTPAAEGLWSSGFQMPRPYDGLLIAVFCISIVAGQSVFWLKRLPPKIEAAGLGILLGIIPLTALPFLRPTTIATGSDPDYLSMIQEEIRGHHMGSFRDGMFLPGLESQLPNPPSDLVSRLSTNNLRQVRNLQASSASSINVVEQNLLQSRFIISSSQSMPVEFYALYDPGWLVEVDGRSQQTIPSANGLLAFTIPAMANELTISLQPTAIQTWSWVVSVFGLFVLLRGSWRLGRQMAPISAVAGSPIESAQSLTSKDILLATAIMFFYLVAVLALTIKPALVFPQELPLQVLTAGNNISLASRNSLPSSVQAGETVNLELFWQANTPLISDYQSELQLVAADGKQLWSAHRHPGGIPTSSWPTDKYVSDNFSIQVPFNAAPGIYSVQVKLSPCDSKSLVICDDPQSFQTLAERAPNAPGVEAELGNIAISAR